MKKYWIIITNEIQRQITYRVNIISYVVGNLLELSAQIVIWTIIFGSVDLVRGYTYQEMITYVIVGWFFMFLTTNYHYEEVITRDIQQGTLSTFLIKPINYLHFNAVRSLGRVSVAFVVVIFQGLLILTIFSDKVIFSSEISVYIILFLMLVLSYLMKLLLSVLIGSLAFWTTDTSGTYYSVNVLVSFLSGAFFPINLLPEVFVKTSLIFPFAYTFYFPTQFYLEKVNIAEAIKGLGIEFIWIIFLYGLIKVVWKYGLKKYESVGI